MLGLLGQLTADMANSIWKRADRSRGRLCNSEKIGKQEHDMVPCIPFRLGKLSIPSFDRVLIVILIVGRHFHRR